MRPPEYVTEEIAEFVAERMSLTQAKIGANLSSSVM
jgi:hypothetical protein